MAFNFRVVFSGDAGPLKRAGNQAERSIDGIKRTAVRAAGALAAAYGGTQLTRQLVDVTKRYQGLEAQLRTSTGSAKDSAQVFTLLRDYAAATSQDVESVTTAFTRLVNLGLDPSLEAMTAYGNIAAATGKTTLDFVEAVADAATGEFERLKEFGIKARDEGETVALTFQGVTTRIGDNAEEIEQYLQSLGKEKFGDALANQADTLGGALTRLGLSWDEFMNSVSEAGVGGVMGDVIDQATESLTELAAMIESGQLQAGFNAWINQFEQVAIAAQTTDNFIYSSIASTIDSMRVFESESNDMRLFENLPVHLAGITQILAIQAGSAFDAGLAYGEGYYEGLVSTLELTRDRALAIVYEINDKLNPLDGNTFNFEDAWDKAGDTFDNRRVEIMEGIKKDVAVINQAADSAMLEVGKAATKIIGEYDKPMEEARQRRAQWEAERANMMEGLNLGKFQTGGEDGEGGESGGKDMSEGRLAKLHREMATERELMIFHLGDLHRLNLEAYENGKISHDQYMEYKLRANEQYLRNVRQAEAAQTVATLSNYQSLFGNMASLTSTFAGKQSGAYKALFAVSKGFAIANSVISIQAGIADAMKLGFPQNIPIIAQTAAQGASVLSTIKGTQFQGQAHDGISRVPAANEGTWMLRRDEMVLSPTQTDNFNYLVEYAKQSGQNAGSRSVTIHNKIDIDAKGAAEGTEQQILEAMDMATMRMKQELSEDFANDGPLYRQVNNRGAAA